MFKKKKKNEFEEVLKNHSQSIQKLQDQVKVLQHTLKYGENGVDVDVFTEMVGFSCRTFKLRAAYVYEDKVHTALAKVGKEVYERYRRGTTKIEVLLTNPTHIIFNLKMSEGGIFWTYCYLVDKEAEVICDYPQIEASEK